MSEETYICPNCNGSGEGNWDGSTCGLCNGKGEIPYDNPYKDCFDEGDYNERD